MTPDRFSDLEQAPARPVVTHVRNTREVHPTGYVMWRQRRVVLIGERREAFTISVPLTRADMTTHRAEAANRLRLARRWIQQRVAKMARVGAPE